MSQEASCSTAHVLAVGDEPEVLDLLRETLTRFGYEVSTATDGEAALELARQRTLDLALCDCHLEGMSGVELAKALHKMHPHLALILTTEDGDTEAENEALAAGASDTATKPLDLSSLPFILEDNLQRKRFEARKLSQEPADVLLKAIKAIAAAVDAKSHCAVSHSARTAALSVAIGAEMGLSPDCVNTLELSGHLHDVGRIGTADSTPVEPVKQWDDEWVDIIKHPAVGSEFLLGIDELADVASAIRHHHEHMDGSGYPDGLRRDAIPLTARILAVADAFEVMTSQRPYRRAISQQEALGELRKRSGKQFDEAVVEAATRVVGSMHADGQTNEAV